MSALTIEQKISEATLYLTFAGQIDEGANYSSVKTAGFKSIIMNFEKIVLINSTGLQAWIKFFRTVEKTASITFTRCSIRLITQINMFPGFMDDRKVQIESFFAPYFCESCDQSCDMLIDSSLHENILKNKKAPEMSCPKCKGKAEFDGIEKKFFMFIKSV
jgi:hypothetical protein